MLPDSDKNIPNAILLLENVQKEDAGEYKCIGTGPNNEQDIAATTVRVKGK